MIHYETLLQNATDIITKCDNYFITKCDRVFQQNVSGFLLQNATVILQNATIITNCDDFITKCSSYYKMWRLLQIATDHIFILLTRIISKTNVIVGIKITWLGKKPE